jgi:hypothetical protein
MTCFLYWLTGFRGEDFKTFVTIGSYAKTTVCPLKSVLRWSTSKIVFSDPDLDPKWPPSADIVLT